MMLFRKNMKSQVKFRMRNGKPLGQPNQKGETIFSRG
nr:ionotropic receptor [Semanotus bifasciatus]